MFDPDDIRRWVQLIIFLIAISCMAAGIGIGVFIVKATAHSWYPIECCSGDDCDIVTNMGKVAPIMVTTSKGIAELTDQTKRHESRDNRLHACIRGGKLICIFFPKSI